MREDEKQALIEFTSQALNSLKGTEPSEPNKFDGCLEEYTTKVLEIALASLTAEPAGEFYEDSPGNWYQRSVGDRAPKWTPLFTVPPAPSVPTEPVSRGETLPDGFKLVPVEPTWDMLSADGCRKHHDSQQCAHHENRKRIWKAMLEAAPATEVT